MKWVKVVSKIDVVHKKQKQPPEVFVKTVLKNFVKFTGKRLCQSLFE